MNTIEKNVISSYDSLDNNKELSYLGFQKQNIKKHKYEILDLLTKIRKQIILSKKINPWLKFEINDIDDELYKIFTRHSSIELDETIPVNKILKVGIINGTFDPFHIGHLLMGLNHLAHGTSDFIIYLPNADMCNNIYSAKPNKRNYNWRFKTVMYGGVEDMFPLLRVSSFGRQSEYIILKNQELIDKLNKINFNIIIGSDLFKKPNMIRKLESDYKAFQKIGSSPSKIEITFHIIQRSNFELNDKEIAYIKDNLTFPIIESPVSDASSTASSTQFKQGDVNRYANIYPSSLNILQEYC